MKKENERPYFVKDSFVLYRSYLDHIELMSLEDRGIWITAILCYVNDLPLPEMPPDVRMAFSFVRKRIDEDYLKYLDTVEKKRKAGQKGGIASGISRRNEASASSASENEANEDDTEYYNEYENDYDPVNEPVSDLDPVPKPVNDDSFDSSYSNYCNQSIKEAKRGIERDTDYDSTLRDRLIRIRQNTSSEDFDETLDDLGITKGR